MAVKHTTLPRWATNDVVDPTSLLNNVLEPAEGKKDIGWNYLEKPARQYYNWLGRQTNQWLDYLDEALNLFAPHETNPATMEIELNPGRINQGTDVIFLGVQTSGAITAPITNPRIDRVVISESTGAITVIAGSEAASPVAPAFDKNSIPIAQILLYVGMTEIVNDDITDERSDSPFQDNTSSDLFLIKPDSTGIKIQFQNSTTGITATDGFFVGIDANEKANIWNYENTDLLIATNNIFRGKISAGGNWLISPNGGEIAANRSLVIYDNASGASYAQFVNSTTLTSATDGFIVGVSSSETANLWNYENTDMLFGTNGTLRGKIAAGGNWLISPDGTDITPNRDLVVYQPVSAAAYMQFCNSTTGTTNVQGFQIGIDSSETAQLINYHNSDMIFQTNANYRGKIAAGGNWLISPGGADVTPNYSLVVHEDSSAANYIQITNSTTLTDITDGLIIGFDANEQAFIKHQHNKDLIFSTNSLSEMYLDASARGVVIGVANPGQGVGTLNAGTALYVNDNRIRDSGDEYTTTGTTASIGTGAVSSTIIITHGLGTDDVEFTLIAKGNSAPSEWTATMENVNNFHRVFAGPNGANGGNYTDPATPLTGTITLRFLNSHSGSQTISYEIVVRKRSV